MTKRALTKRNRRSLRRKTLRSQKGGGFFDGLKNRFTSFFNKLNNKAENATDTLNNAKDIAQQKVCPEITDLKKELAECKQKLVQNNNKDLASLPQSEPDSKIEPAVEPAVEPDVSIIGDNNQKGGKKHKKRGKKSKKKKRKNKKKTRRHRR